VEVNIDKSELHREVLKRASFFVSSFALMQKKQKLLKYYFAQGFRESSISSLTN